MQVISGYLDRRTRANGLDFHYLEWGEVAAPPMVLLHGLTGHAHIWDHMAPSLARGYRVYAPDQRGHGSTEHAAVYATADFVADLRALAQQWGLARFVLMGLSMGGHNSMAFAAAYPELVERVIVIDIPPAFSMSTSKDWENQQRVARDGHRRFADREAAFRDARAGNSTAPDDNLRYRMDWNLKELDDGSLTYVWDARAPVAWDIEDLTPTLSQIVAPTLFVIGGRSEVISRQRAEHVVALFPSATLAEVAESGHSVPTDRPEALTPIVLDWLASNP